METACGNPFLLSEVAVSISGVSYCYLAFSRPLISQPGRNAAENPRWMLKGTVVAGHRVGKGYRWGLAVPPQRACRLPVIAARTLFSTHDEYGQGGL